jgi:hypothetical protein
VASAKKKSRSSASSSIESASTAKSRFVVCIDNQGYEASLEKAKLYSIIPDRRAAAAGLIRVVDESGEDYSYPSDRFFPVRLPAILQRHLSAGLNLPI